MIVVPVVVLNWNFLASLDVEQFQIVQESYENVVVKLVLARESEREHLDEVVRKIERHFKPELGGEMDIIVEFVDQIVPTRKGKRRFVLSKVTKAC